MTPETITTDADVDAVVGKDLDLTRRFALAVLDDPSLLAGIPDGALVELLPDDDPAYVEVALARGVGVVRAGQNVYFRHVRVRDLPQ